MQFLLPCMKFSAEYAFLRLMLVLELILYFSGGMEDG